jgi:hypothetical protein
VGSPRQGGINDSRIKAKLEYKQAIKKAASESERLNSDDLGTYLSERDSKSFWKTWNSMQTNKSTAPNSVNYVNGSSDPKAIANSFKDFYSNVYVNSSDNISAVDEFKCFYDKHYSNNYYSAGAINNDHIIDVECVERCVKMLKCNKAAGHDDLVAEHIINAHPAVIVHLKLLFSMMMTHSHVPEPFGSGIIIPIIKDKRGDVTSVDNYRPITLSPVISKIFESALLDKYSHYMKSDDLQFGFKKGLGCTNAIFSLRKVVEYFNSRDSNVYLASLDASKAFDRVNHYKLFTTLIKAGLPKYFVDIIINWYLKLCIVVRWDGANSSPLSVLSGVRQGGILSPILFNLYVNCFLTSLRKLDLGCHVKNLFLGCIMYADDLLLLSPSVVNLQRMLDLCDNMGRELDIRFNCTKSKCICIGPHQMHNLAIMTISNAEIKWVDEIKYLGLSIKSNKVFTIDYNDIRRKFFVSVNCILNKCKYSSDIVKLQLLESHCLPILLYVIESLNLATAQMKDINSWWNSVYRKIFGYNKWDSVKELICLLGRLDIHHLVFIRRVLFIKHSLLCTNNAVFLELTKSYANSPEAIAVRCTHKIDFCWSSSKIKSVVYASFRNLVH